MSTWKLWGRNAAARVIAGDFFQRLQVTETLGPGLSCGEWRRGCGEEGSLGAAVQVVVCPRAPRPQQVWSVVELGSYVLGKAQPHLSTYGP